MVMSTSASLPHGVSPQWGLFPSGYPLRGSLLSAGLSSYLVSYFSRSLCNVCLLLVDLFPQQVFSQKFSPLGRSLLSKSATWWKRTQQVCQLRKSLSSSGFPLSGFPPWSVPPQWVNSLSRSLPSESLSHGGSLPTECVSLTVDSGSGGSRRGGSLPSQSVSHTVALLSVGSHHGGFPL